VTGAASRAANAAVSAAKNYVAAAVVSYVAAAVTSDSSQSRSNMDRTVIVCIYHLAMCLAIPTPFLSASASDTPPPQSLSTE